MKNKILILGAGIMQIPIIKKGKELGYEVIVADYDKEAPGFEFADKTYLVSTLDHQGILKIADKEQISGILTTSDAPVRVVAYVANKLGLHSMSEQTSELFTDKYKQRLFFKSNGIKTPEFYLCTDESDLHSLSSFPYIVKPVDSSASRGVKKVNNPEELLRAFQEALKYSRKGECIIESYISGREFSVETLTQNKQTYIIAITEKITGGGEGFFVEYTHLQPARLNNLERDLIEEEVKKAIAALGLDNSPTHTEIKINSEGAQIIEMACRLGGDYITSHLVPLSTGIDMLGNLIKIAVGLPIDTRKSIDKSSCVQFLTPENYVRCIDYIQRNKNSIITSEVYPYINKPIRNSMDRLGYIILQRENISQIETELSKIH